MMTWTRIVPNGYGVVELRPETRDEREALVQMHAASGFHIAIEHDEQARRYRFFVRMNDDPDGSQPTSPTNFSAMDDDDLHTFAAKVGVKAPPNIKRVNLIKKLIEWENSGSPT